VARTGDSHWPHLGGALFAREPNGTWIVSGANDGTLSIWDVATGAELATLTGHTSVCCVAR